MFLAHGQGRCISVSLAASVKKHYHLIGSARRRLPRIRTVQAQVA